MRNNLETCSIIHHLQQCTNIEVGCVCVKGFSAIISHFRSDNNKHSVRLLIETALEGCGTKNTARRVGGREDAIKEQSVFYSSFFSLSPSSLT